MSEFCDLFMSKYDIVIIGAGILGTTISYWLSTIYDLNVCVIETLVCRSGGVAEEPAHDTFRVAILFTKVSESDLEAIFNYVEHDLNQ